MKEAVLDVWALVCWSNFWASIISFSSAWSSWAFWMDSWWTFFELEERVRDDVLMDGWVHRVGDG
jgi:hypothetical protein